MIQKLTYRFASLVLVACFAVASIGADNCLGIADDPPPLAAPPSSSSAACPSSADQRYTCTVPILEVSWSLCTPPAGVRSCSGPFGWTPCASSLAEAEAMTVARAGVKALGGTHYVGKPTCAIWSLYGMNPVSPILNDLALDGSCTCNDGTGGSSTGGSCAANTDACTTDADCCSSMCSEQGACESCRGDLEGCVNNADCCSGTCSLNACGGNALHLHDGGIGFEEGTP